MEERRVYKGVDNWPRLLSRYWSFVEKFRGTPYPSKGDVRAYISALADIVAVEVGIKSVEEMRWALGEALTIVKRVGLSKYDRVMREWRVLDREPIRRSIKKGRSKLKLPKPEEDDNGLHVVSLFTGSYGLDLGFEYAGFKVAVALDNDPSSEQIVRVNRPKIPFIMCDIAKVSTKELLSEAGLDKREVDVLTGGPPCQPFSTAGRRRGLSDPRASPLKEFIRVINEAQPKAFVMEEVTGLLNARLKHVPIKDRNRPLLPEEQRGSVWRVVLEELKRTGYKIMWKVLNAADFGTPQIRKRVIVIGLRRDIKTLPSMPTPTHRKPSASTLMEAEPWVCLLDALAGVEPGAHIELPPKYAKYMEYVPPGGSWRQIPKSLAADAMNGAFMAGGGRMGFYRRLTWFEPSPTLVTTPIMKGSMLVHPAEDRPLSVNEYKVIQGFPEDWKVLGSLSAQYRKIGEAVPPLLSYAVASKLRQILINPD